MYNRLKKFNIILIAVNILLLTVFAVLFAIISGIKANYSSDSAKQLWDNDVYKYSQISVYMNKADGMDIMGIYSLRKSIESKLTENSVKADKDCENTGRLWLDSSCGEEAITVTGTMGSCDVIATGTFGDYFIFHPIELVSGSYYSDDDVNFDRIILDKDSSWQLFGALDTAGMTVTINNKYYKVAAVVETPEDKSDKAAYGNSPRVYMPFEALAQINSSARMNVYEVCLPEIVDGFAKGIVTDVIPSAADRGIIVDQSDRFDLITLFKGFQNISEDVMITKPISYPWFENRLRGAEIKAKILAGPSVYLLIIPAVSLIYLLFFLAKLAGKGIRKIRDKAEQSYQKRISEAYYKKHSDK